MPDLVVQRDMPLATQAQAATWGMERMHRRLDLLEARLDGTRGDERAPAVAAASTSGRILPVMAGMAVAALALIAGTMLWQVTHPVPPGQPTVVVNTPAPVIQNTTPASAQMPSFRSPGLVLPPRQAPRGYFPHG